MNFWRVSKKSSFFNGNPIHLKGKALKVTSFLFSLLTIASFSLLLSCTGAPQQQPFQVGPSIERDPERGRSRSRLSSRRRSRRVNCRDIGNESCEGNANCEDACDDIFSKNTSKNKCIDLNVELVEDFYEIFAIMEDGDDFESINPDSLNCLLNVSETEFSREVGRLGHSDSESFLEALALNEDLTDVLKSEDNILSKLLNNLGSAGDLEALGEKIEGSSHFIDLIVENENEEAWKWVIEFISEECRTSPYCQAQGDNANNLWAKELVFFCKIYEGSHSKVDELLDSTFFSERYSNDIEDIIQCGTGSLRCNSNRKEDFLSNSSNQNTVCKYLAGIPSS